MKSLTITYDDGVARNRSLREHIATQVYAGAGITAIAGRLDMSPSKLTEKLAGCDSSGKPRGFSIDDLERYIAETKDVSPIHYLVERYLISPEAQHAEALAQFAKLAALMEPLAKSLGAKWP